MAEVVKTRTLIAIYTYRPGNTSYSWSGQKTDAMIVPFEPPFDVRERLAESLGVRVTSVSVTAVVMESDFRRIPINVDFPPTQSNIPE